jgi:hypothetical protein
MSNSNHKVSMKRKMTALVASTMLAITGASFLPLVTPFTEPALANTKGTSLGIAGVAFGVAGLVNALQRGDDEKRSEFTQRTISELTQKYPDYNFVITHHKGSKAEGPEVVHDHVELKMAAGSAGYEIFGSRKGQPFRFELNGDGGYLNWAFGGDFNRDGNTLTAK